MQKKRYRSQEIFIEVLLGETTYHILFEPASGSTVVRVRDFVASKLSGGTNPLTTAFKGTAPSSFDREKGLSGDRVDLNLARANTFTYKEVDLPAKIKKKIADYHNAEDRETINELQTELDDYFRVRP